MMQRPVGPREQIEAALVRIGVAVKALERAGDCLVSPRQDARKWRDGLATSRTDLNVIAGRMRDALEELTPSAQASRTDMKAVFDTVQDWSERPAVRRS